MWALHIHHKYVFIWTVLIAFYQAANRKYPNLWLWELQESSMKKFYLHHYNAAIRTSSIIRMKIGLGEFYIAALFLTLSVKNRSPVDYTLQL